MMAHREGKCAEVVVKLKSEPERRTVRQNLKAKVQKSWKASGSASTSSSTPGSARFTCATVVAFSAASPAAR